MEPITIVTVSVLFAAGSVFAIFLGLYSERLESRRHRE